MAQRSYMFILFASFCAVINCAIPAKDNTNLAVEYRPEVVAVLNHLNSAPIKVYNFKNAVVESALQKADITELTLDVNVECLNKYPDLPCTDDTLTCNAFVQRPSLPGLGGTVLGDVKCKPKSIANVDNAANPADAAVAEEPEVPPPSSRSPKESISLSNEAVSQESGENFVAVRRDSAVPCLGCAVDINTDALGVDELVNLGLQHVEQENVKKHALVKVLRIQQQVVSGVKYILLAEIAPTVCDKNAPYNLDACPVDTKAKISTCEITYLQKPWINKAKHIIANNCTRSQEYVAPESSSSSLNSDIKYANNEIDNEIEMSSSNSGGSINSNHRIKSFLPGDKRPFREELNFDRIAESGTIDEEMSPSRLADLESQILFVEPDLPPAPTPKQVLYQQQAPRIDDNPETVRFTLDVMPNTDEFPSLYTEQPEEPSIVPVAVSSSSTYLEANMATEDRPSNSQNTEESLNLDVDNLPSSSSSTNFDTNDNDNFEFGSSTSVPSDDEISLTSTESTSSTTVNSDLADEVQSDQAAQAVPENDRASSEENSSSEEINSTKSPKIVKVEELSRSGNAVRKQSSSEENSSEENSSEEKNSESQQNSRQKRAVPHMEKISHEEKNLVKDLADYAAVALDNMDDDNNRRVVLQILGAKKMVTEDGIYYRLILRLGISQCSENKPPKPNENCKEKLLENYTKICKVQIYVNDEVSNPKVVKSQCQNIKRDNKSDSNRTNYSRHRREVLVGGQQPYDKNDLKIGQFVQESLSRLDSESSHKTRYKPIEIVEATSQVVSGALYRIKVKTALSDCPKDDQNKKLEECGLLNDAKEPPRECLIKVWDRPWLKRREITINCEGQAEHKFEVTEKGARTQRQTRLLGGQIQESVDSPNVYAYLQHGLRHLDAQSRHENKLKVLQVLSATKQIVSGQLWRIKAQVAVSDCNKNDLREPENCGILEDGRSQVCEFRVWDQPWLPNGLQIDVSCDDDDKQYSFRSKRSNPETQSNSFKKRSDLKPRGGINPVSVNDTEVLEHLTKGLQHLDSQSSHQNKYRVHEVVSASHQTVSGSLWRIEAKIVLSDCSKNDNKDLTQCKTLEGSVPKTCNFKVWDQPWLPHGREINITCENEERQYSFRSKRSLPGGVNQADFNDPVVSQYLTTALEHLDSESSHQNKYKVDKVLIATKQVVSGSLWKIKAQIVLSECSKNDNNKKQLSECRSLLGASPRTCIFEIWDQPWLPQGRETKINCEDEQRQYLFRSKRDVTTHRSQRSVPGGISSTDENSPEIAQFLTSGLQHLDSQSSHENKYRVHEVVSASHQTVAGSLWRIEAKIVLSDCSKNDNKDLTQCKTLEGSVPKTCNFKVWDQPWLPNGREINITCENEERQYSFRSKRSTPGGVSQADLNDPVISQYLTTGLQHLDSESSHQNKYKVHKVLSATKQVVSGSLWKIKAQIVLSECTKNDNNKKQLSECRSLLGASPRTCDFEIWDQPWLPEGRQTKINCEDEQRQHTFRSKRAVRYLHTTHFIGKEDRNLHFAMFRKFLTKHKRQYSSKQEFKRRFHIFRQNFKYIAMLNRYEQGTAKYGITQFADQSRKEFSRSLGLRPDLRQEESLSLAPIPAVDLPVEFDWRDKGAVTPVKNQGQCGSCWAFSVTGNVEGQYKLKHGNLLELSEQELVDCDTVDEGCNGGLMDNAYRAIEKLGGLETESDYPYDAEDEKCHFNRTLARVQLTGALNISHNETDMAKWLVQNGPISIAINANAMQFYMGGVSHPLKFLCSPKSLDHGVLVVGYGVHKYPLFNKTLPYWIVKNSWGRSWGEQGYYRVYRGDGTCGLNQTPSSAIVA